MPVISRELPNAIISDSFFNGKRKGLSQQSYIDKVKYT
jgi:hypothetical protein